ncbi:MAG: hypothetical protein FWD15_04495 [Alphaproteobacteria bacterium]|nr:hypothetical protein [Alphaproteobacteria bacterium]
MRKLLLLTAMLAACATTQEEPAPKIDRTECIGFYASTFSEACHGDYICTLDRLVANFRRIAPTCDVATVNELADIFDKIRNTL